MRVVEACGCGAGVGAGARGRGGGGREREEHCSSSAGRVMLAEFRCMEFFVVAVVGGREREDSNIYINGTETQCN